MMFRRPLSVLAPLLRSSSNTSRIVTTYHSCTSVLSSTPQMDATSTTTTTTSSSLSSLSDDELLSRVVDGSLSVHKLETALDDCSRAVDIRRRFLKLELTGLEAQGKTAFTPAPGRRTPSTSVGALPHREFDADLFYHQVLGQNCEAVVGYLPLPVGVVGPLAIDDRVFHVPLATTEGALVASVNRGCRAITQAGGATAIVTGNAMTRAPLLRLPSLSAVQDLVNWVRDPTNTAAVAEAFNSTSRFARLRSVSAHPAGRNVYLRFNAHTGDAMGMNAISKGCNAALQLVTAAFPDASVESLSGNMCSDKKPSAINWLEGRGKSVTAEAVIPPDVVASVLKTSVGKMATLNVTKNLIGSAMAGSIGGNNAHASNMVTALYLATGQDPAQNVESSTCLTLLEEDSDGNLVASVSMPSVEVGTVGGGTALPAQKAMLEMLGCGGSCNEDPGHNAETLAKVVAGTVLAGELSLMAALTTDDLLSAHLELNRAKATPGASDDGASAGAPTATGHVSDATSVRRFTASASPRIPHAALSPGSSMFDDASTVGLLEGDDGDDEPRLSIP